jgi:hypothetical protein
MDYERLIGKVGLTKSLGWAIIGERLFVTYQSNVIASNGETVYHRWAEILGQHAAKVFQIMSGLFPESLEIVEADIDGGPRYPLGVRVDFKGRDQGEKTVKGFFVCAFDTIESAGDIASAIAIKLGLAPPPPGDATDIDNVLGEFLNIVIGLTCSAWAEHGLTTEFDPPQTLSMHDKDATLVWTKAYHLTMSIENHPAVSIFLVFLPQEAGQSPSHKT